MMFSHNSCSPKTMKIDNFNKKLILIKDFMYLEKGQYFEAPKMPYFAKKASLPKKLNLSNFLQFHKPFFLAK